MCSTSRQGNNFFSYLLPYLSHILNLFPLTFIQVITSLSYFFISLFICYILHIFILLFIHFKIYIFIFSLTYKLYILVFSKNFLRTLLSMSPVSKVRSHHLFLALQLREIDSRKAMR